MNDLQSFIQFINCYSLEVLLLGGIVTVVTGIVKKLVPDRVKSLIGLLPFIFGIIFYALYSIFVVKNYDVFHIVNKGFQSGGVATLYYAFFKQILSSSGSVKKAVQDVLKGILSTSAIKEVATLISNNFSRHESDEETENTVKEILKTNAGLPDDVTEAIAKLIAITLSNKKS